jgi:very-short-patch-repair endonuclease
LKQYFKNTNEYIEHAKKVHGDKYDYSKTIFKTAKDKIIITCKKHGDFEQEAYCHSIGVGCTICMNKTEAKLNEKIVSIFPSLLKQFRQEWCINELSKTNKYLPFDFCIPEYKIIIELDGPQHFRQIMNWKTPEEQQKSDKFKEECANNNGYSVIRLLQEDVMNDTYDWVKELCDAIEQIKSSNEITNIYLSKNNEYDNF